MIRGISPAVSLLRFLRLTPVIVLGIACSLMSSCGVNQELGRNYCHRLSEVKRDHEGYYDQNDVLTVVGYSIPNRFGGPFYTDGVRLEGRYFLALSHRERKFRPIPAASIDEILNNPRRSAFYRRQIDSIVLLDRWNRVVCRFDSASK